MWSFRVWPAAARLSRRGFLLRGFGMAGFFSAGTAGYATVIEPEPICWADTGRATADLIRRVRAKSLKINYDPGNVAWLQNRDPLDEFRVIAPLIANVHVKDLKPLTEGAGRPEWVPAGEGMIDYRAHFQALRQIDYQGPVSLEPHMDSSEESTRNDIRSIPWKVYHRVVVLPTALGV